MIGVKSSHHRYGITALAFGLLLAGGLLALPAAAWAQSSEGTAQKGGDQTDSQTYTVKQGDTTYTRTEQTEHKQTPDGEVETQRVLSSAGGEEHVIMEKEIRTKKLPNGDVVKEYILKNPSLDGQLVPIEITHETIKHSGDSTAVEREVTKPDSEGHWKTTRKENETETGPDSAKQTVKEVRELNIDGAWRVVDREVTSTKSSNDLVESHSVLQIPNAEGKLADYEVRDQRTTTQAGQETTDLTVRRRDLANPDRPQFYLVEHTSSARETAPDGKVVTHSTTESDTVAGGASRNMDTGHPKLVEEKTEEETTGRDGSKQVVVKVSERGVGDSRMQPATVIVTQKDAKGNVSQVLIPAQ